MSIVSPNLGLVIWSLSTDPYDSSELADNGARVDEHDHSNGKGVQIGTAGIADGAITAAKLAAGAIPPTPAESPVDTSRLVDGSVTTAKLADNSITTSKLTTVPTARAITTSTTAIATSGTFISFTSAVHDTASMWTTANRLIFPVSGTYQIIGDTIWSANANVEFVKTELIVNGSTDIAHQASNGYQGPVNSLFLALNTTQIYRATAGEYVQLKCTRDSAYSASVTTASLSAAFLGI